MNDTQPAETATDPFEPMRRAYEEAFQSWSETWQQASGGEELAAASSGLLSGYMAMQESLRAASQLTADALHLPSKDDLARTAQLVVNVERKVDEVADQTHSLLARANGPSADRLASVDDRLGAMEAKLNALAARPEPPASLDDRLGAMEAKLTALAARPEPPAPPDGKLGAIEAKLDALAARPEPPASLDDRLGAIEAKLDALAARPEPPAPASPPAATPTPSTPEAKQPAPKKPAPAKRPAPPRKRRTTAAKEG